MTGLLQDYLDAQAERRPEEVAVVLGAERMTFGGLARASNRLARLLKDGGCQPGDRIAFLMPKSPAAIIAMLGTLKADCVYVPMDPTSPVARLSRVVEASAPRWLLASGPVAATIDHLVAASRPAPMVGWMDAEGGSGNNFAASFTSHDLAPFSGEPLAYRNSPGDAAHILFTSGSTGQPKGVVITHAMVTTFVAWANAYFSTTHRDRTSGHSSLHFDLSTFDVYGALAAGAELHLVPPELNLVAPKLAEFIRSSELTQWFSVPSILNYLAKFDVVRQDDFPALKRLLWCGEVLPTPSLIHWMRRLPHVTFTNLYGPTETTIASSYYTVPAVPTSETAAIPIGTACPGEELHVLDAELRPVPTGDKGDLFIAGVGLSPGYWQSPELTQRAFLRLPADPTKRIYRTGDIASRSEDALYHFHGRSDSQIKSRGYRIELGEIESALNAMDGIRECAVVAIASSGFEGSTICCAYAAAEGISLDSAGIRRALVQIVPSYMLPTRWLSLPAIPKNVNGKIDRVLLRERFEAGS